MEEVEYVGLGYV